jgi:elongation factor Ts
VPADLIAKERSVAEAKAAESGKPADIVAKMVEGSVQKYLKEVSLADQVFVKAADGKQTVAQMLKAANTNVKGFTCTWWAKASRRRWTTSPPKWLPRWPLPRRLKR